LEPEQTKEKLEQSIHEVIDPLNELYREEDEKYREALKGKTTMKYAYVTFRNAEDYKRVFDFYQISWFKWILVNFCTCFFSREK
jgi:hypothetical protein